MPAPIIDAVTALLMHQGELFLARRHQALAAFPGYHAFPGGKVDRGDADRAPDSRRFAALEPGPARALIRELQEELGFDLEQHPDVHSVRPIGRVLTPPVFPVRFDTRFYAIELNGRPDFALDEAELSGGEWAGPRHWLDRYERGELLLAPPTLIALQTLAADARADTLDFGDIADEPAIPMIEIVHGVRQYFVRSNTLPPAAHTNCFLIGDAGARRILVDPSPCNREEMERLLRATGTKGFDEIFLTHHHRDHCEHADEIARRCQVPVGMSEWTRDALARDQPGFLQGIEVRLYRDGDEVTQWNRQPVRALAVPGHHEGQLALMPDDRAWCIVGDLIQGIGTVVIAPPEGNMRRYFASMERVIGLAPRAIYPSHGGALGGVHYLQQALGHRRQREAQVLALHQAGHSIDQMLPVIYKDVDPRLMPLARINIESHLEKLREEGLIAA